MKGGRREGGRDCKEWIEKERHINKEGEGSRNSRENVEWKKKEIEK